MGSWWIAISSSTSYVDGGRSTLDGASSNLSLATTSSTSCCSLTSRAVCSGYWNPAARRFCSAMAARRCDKASAECPHSASKLHVVYLIGELFIGSKGNIVDGLFISNIFSFIMEKTQCVQIKHRTCRFWRNMGEATTHTKTKRKGPTPTTSVIWGCNREFNQFNTKAIGNSYECPSVILYFNCYYFIILFLIPLKTVQQSL